MTGGELSLGRIMGVKVGVSWGLLAVSAFFTLSLAVNQYPFAFPGRDTSQYWLVAVATTVLFSASILVHELGHAVVARGDQVGVDGVTLWMFGGVARLTSLPRTAASEARIALAGPAATGVAAGVFWVLAAVTQPGDRASLAANMFDWLSRTNLLLLGLNLLPAQPLDGGRVLAAAAWRVSGRREIGNLIAARAGWLVGGVLALYGLVLFRRGDPEGLWLILVGGFVLSSSYDFERQRRTAQHWVGRSVGEVMRTNPPIVEDWMTVEALLQHLAARAEPTGRGRHDVFPVRDQRGEITGVVHLAAALSVPESQRRLVHLEQLTEPRRNVPVVSVDEPLERVVRDHPEVRHSAVMVVDDTGRIVGVLGPEGLAPSASSRRRPRPQLATGGRRRARPAGGQR